MSDAGTKPRWTEAELDLALDLVDQGCSLAEIALALGRTLAAVESKFRIDRNGSNKRPGSSHVSGPVLVPLRVLIERDRAQRPQSLQATMFGDPPPGRSALDRKRAQELGR